MIRWERNTPSLIERLHTAKLWYPTHGLANRQNIVPSDHCVYIRVGWVNRQSGKPVVTNDASISAWASFCTSEARKRISGSAINRPEKRVYSADTVVSTPPFAEREDVRRLWDRRNFLPLHRTGSHWFAQDTHLNVDREHSWKTS